MYGFGGLGEVEVEIWSDVTMAGRTDDKERQSYSDIRQWKAEMSNKKPKYKKTSSNKKSFTEVTIKTQKTTKKDTKRQKGQKETQNNKTDKKTA